MHILSLPCWCIVALLCQSGCVQHRNIVDISATHKDRKRDFLFYLQNVMIVVGEDKASYADMAVARKELLDKHQPSNMMVFGRLGYILLIATAGTRLEVEALPVGGASILTTIVADFQFQNPIAARSALTTG